MSYIDSSRGLYPRCWRKDVHHRRPGDRVRSERKCSIRHYLLDLPNVPIRNGLTKSVKPFLYLKGLIFRSVLGRGNAGALLEGAAKVIYAGKSAFFCNCGHGEGGIHQQLLGLADPDVKDILLGGNMIAVPEQLSQVNLADSHVLCKVNIGQGRILNMLLDILRNKIQPVCILLLRGIKLRKEVVKCAVNFHPAFVPQEQLPQGLKALDAALRIVHGEKGNFRAVKACAGKVDNGKQPFAVTNKAVSAALGQENDAVWVADIGFFAHRVCDLTAHAKGDSEARAVLLLIIVAFFGMHDECPADAGDNQLVERNHKHHPSWHNYIENSKEINTKNENSIKNVNIISFFTLFAQQGKLIIKKKGGLLWNLQIKLPS